MSDLTHISAAGTAHMVDVGEKPVTRRTATAEAIVRISPALAEAIAADTLKKGDALAVARLAGTAAAKRTSDLIPLCHPLPIDSVSVNAVLEGDSVRITTTVSTTWRTGVEMEAMTAASVAALTVMDMGKSVDRGIVIESVRLLSKTGGQRGDYAAKTDPASAPMMPNDPGWHVAILTVSDRCSRGEADDRSGPALAAALRDAFGVTNVVHALAADEVSQIGAALRAWLAQSPSPELILTTGGTGLSPRDVTPEAVLPLIDRPCPQLLELARRRLGGAEPRAFLSRGVAGVAGRSLVLTLPGSPGGAADTLLALADVLPHALRVLGGDGDPHAERQR